MMNLMDMDPAWRDGEIDRYTPGLKVGSREGADYDWCQGACEMS